MDLQDHLGLPWTVLIIAVVVRQRRERRKMPVILVVTGVNLPVVIPVHVLLKVCQRLVGMPVQHWDRELQQTDAGPGCEQPSRDQLG